MNGMKNYLVRHGEGDLHDIINEERTKVSYRTRAIITRGLYSFYTNFVVHFFVFKEVFSENFVLITLFKDNSLSQFYFPGLFSLFLIHT